MRVKSPRRQRHNKILQTTKGFRMSKHRLYKIAKEAAVHAGQYAYIGRKNRKRDLRRTWITRLSAALTPFGISYSQFIDKLKKANITLDRKTLSHLAIFDSEAFTAVVEKIK